MTVTVNTSDGQEVAKAFFLYLNGCYDRKALHQHLVQYKKPAHNFVALAYQWLYELSRVDYWDGRNEASVRMARDFVSQRGIYDGYDFGALLQHAKNMPVQTLTIDRASSAEVAHMLGCYLTDRNAENGGCSRTSCGMRCGSTRPCSSISHVPAEAGANIS